MSARARPSEGLNEVQSAAWPMLMAVRLAVSSPKCNTRSMNRG